MFAEFWKDEMVTVLEMDCSPLFPPLVEVRLTLSVFSPFEVVEVTVTLSVVVVEWSGTTVVMVDSEQPLSEHEVMVTVVVWSSPCSVDVEVDSPVSGQ